MKKVKFTSAILSSVLLLCAFAGCNPATSSQESTPAHTCESVCETCGKCTDMDCTQDACAEKCPIHPDPNWQNYELSFMSFNINFSSSSIEGDEKQGVKSWTNRREAVLQLINDSNADLIGLQEVANWNTEEVNQRIYLEQNIASQYEMIYFYGNVNLAMIYNKRTFNLVETEQYWFSDTPDVESYGWDGVNYRSAVILTLEHKQTGEKIKAINTHGPLDDNGNVKAFELLAERSLSDDNDMVTVLMGDFNATPNKLGYVPIEEKLEDCRYAAMESPNRDHRTWNGYNATATGVLDYCFTTRSANVEILTYQVHNQTFGEGYYLSDHFAVQSTIKVHRPTGDSVA